MLTIEHRSPVRDAHLPDLCAKKSRSTISSPILACSRSISRSWSAGALPPASNARAAWVLKLLFPGVDLVRMYLIALRQIGHARLLAQRLPGDLRLQSCIDPPSRPLSHRPLRLIRDGAFSNYAPGPNFRVHLSHHSFRVKPEPFAIWNIGDATRTPGQRHCLTISVGI
jgi:hypothetical protein